MLHLVIVHKVLYKNFVEHIGVNTKVSREMNYVNYTYMHVDASRCRCMEQRKAGYS